MELMYFKSVCRIFVIMKGDPYNRLAPCILIRKICQLALRSLCPAIPKLNSESEYVLGVCTRLLEYILGYFRPDVVYRRAAKSAEETQRIAFSVFPLRSLRLCG